MGLGDNNFDYLLKANTPAITGPLDMARSGATLAQLLQGVQKGDIELQTARQGMAMMQDPSYLSALSGMLGGGQGGGGSAPGYGPGGGGSGPMDLSFLSKFPAAAPGALQNILKMRLEGAQANENNAKASDYQQKILNARLEKVASSAQAVADDPSPSNIQAYVVNHAFSGAAQDAFGGTPSTMDPQAWAQYGSNVYKQLTDPKVRAETAMSIINAKQAPAKLGIEQQNSDTEAANLAFNKAKFYKGEPFQDPDSKKWFVKIPNPNGVGFTIIAADSGMPTTAPPAQPSVAGAAPHFNLNNASLADVQGAVADAQNGAPDINSGPVTGPTFRQKKELEVATPEVGHLAAQAQAAANMKSMLVDLRNSEAQGIYSGGVTGTDFFQKIANIGAAMGTLTPEQQAKLSNTQAWNAETGNLVAQAVSQFAGSRVAAREIPFFQSTKPDDIQTPVGRAKIYQALWNISSRVQQQADQAQTWLDKGNTSLAKFQPKFEDSPLPAIKLDSLPNPKTWKGGALKDDQGNVLRVVNGQWVSAATGRAPSLSDQVPQ